MKIGLLLLMVVFVVVLIGLFVISYKMLTKIRQEEKQAQAGQIPERQLHPKLQAELEACRRKDQ